MWSSRWRSACGWGDGYRLERYGYRLERYGFRLTDGVWTLASIAVCRARTSDNCRPPIPDGRRQDRPHETWGRSER